MLAWWTRLILKFWHGLPQLSCPPDDWRRFFAMTGSDYAEPAAASNPCVIDLGCSLPSPGGCSWQQALHSGRTETEPEVVTSLRQCLCDLRTWPSSSFCNDWTVITDAHPFVHLVHRLQPHAGPVGAYHVFVDGSFFPKTGNSAWAFEVVLQLPGNCFWRWGYTGAAIEGESSPLRAEATGALAALNWTTTTLVDSARPVTLYCDATCIGVGISGKQAMPAVVGCDAGHCRAF